MHTQSILRVFAAFAVSLLLAGTVNAAGVGVGPAASIFLNQSDQDDRFPDGINYLQVDIWNGSNGSIDFVVRPLHPLSGLIDSGSTNSGIDSFAFNFGNSGATAENIVMTGRYWEVSTEKMFNGFGEFDVILVGDTQRKHELQFSIVGVEGDTALDYLSTLSRGNAPQGNFLIGAGLATDVQQSLKNGIALDRARFAGGSAAVPIPAAVWLLASGLGFLGFFSRKQARVNAAL